MPQYTAPNCYACIYRNEVPGNAHSACGHPCFKGKELLAVIAFIKKINLPDCIEVTANPHGVANGWFIHPVNFDPAWLESCTGFTQKS